MNEYLFIPYNPVDALILKFEEGTDLYAQFRKRAKATSLGAHMFAFDKDKANWRGLKLLYMAVDRRIMNGNGEFIEQI